MENAYILACGRRDRHFGHGEVVVGGDEANAQSLNDSSLHTGMEEITFLLSQHNTTYDLIIYNLLTIRAIFIVTLLTAQQGEDEQYDAADIRDKRQPIPPSASACIMQSSYENRYSRAYHAKSHKSIDDTCNTHCNIPIPTREQCPKYSTYDETSHED